MELWHTRTCGLVPNVYAVNAYDSLMITKEIIETRGVTNKPENLETDRERIREGWATLKEFKGVVGGPITVAPTGDAVKDVYILEARGKTWQGLR